MQQQLQLVVGIEITASGAISQLLGQEERLRVPDRFTIIPVGAGEFRLHSLSFSLALKGRSADLVERLLPLLDGKNTVREIVLQLWPSGQDAVEDTLEYLLESGALERVASDKQEHLSVEEARRFRSQIAFLSNFTAPRETVERSQHPMATTGLEFQHRLKKSNVVVLGMGRLGTQLLRSLVLSGVGSVTVVDSELVGEEDLISSAWFEPQQLGLNRAEAARCMARIANPDSVVRAAEKSLKEDLSALLSECDFAVLCPDHFNPDEYERFNTAALAAKVSWTSARVSGVELQIGPTVIPFETPCFRCFTLRLKSNVPDHSEYAVVEEYLRSGRLRANALAITPGADLLAMEVLKAVSSFMPPATYSHLYSLNLLTLQSRLHPVLKIPRCPDCGRPAMPRPTIHVWQQHVPDAFV